MTHLAVTGPLVIQDAATRKADLLAALGAGTALTVDLGGVDEIDTSGVQLLLLLAREAGRAGVELSVLTSPAVDEAIDLLGLHGRITTGSAA